MYKYLSTCYDFFMRGVDYDGWANRLAEKIGDRKRGVDCGCGSGMITYRLKKLGYDVIGMDVSREMLDIAAQNFASVGESITLVQMDSTKLKLARPVEFITAVCDVVNYIKNPLAFFKKAYENLAGGGVLLFDVSSAYKLKEVIGNNVFTDSSNEVTYVWTNELSKNQTKVDMNLTFFTKNSQGSYDKTEESQTQYVHEQSALEEMLKEAGFSTVEVYGAKGKNIALEEQRLFFVAYK